MISGIVLATVHVRPSSQAVPLAAGCLAAALPEALRRRTRLVDGFLDQKEGALCSAILASDPELVAFPLYLWNRRFVLSLAARLKALSPDLFLVAGGPEAQTDTAGLLEGGFDAAVCGEGEETFRSLVEALHEGKKPPRIPGLVTAGQAGLANAPPEPPRQWPSPWLTGVLRPEEGGGVLWELSRGCSFACDFCYDGRGSRGVRHVSAQRMEAELDLFIAAGVSRVWVLDSTFNFPPERGKALLRLIEAKGPAIHFHFEAKADFIDRETARLLGEIPCSVQIGLQSVHPEVLSNIHRSFDATLFDRKMHLLAAEGVTFGLDLIYGLPGDDFAGFRQSLDAALSYAPNHVDIFPLAVLPGTPLHRRRERFGIRSESTPPYGLIESAGCDAADLKRCRLLAGAADLFYNLGRAVGFFSALTRALGVAPADFLEGFAGWATEARQIDEETFIDAERWEPAEILTLQEDYVRHRLAEAGRPELTSAALDLIRYHFHHAETLMGDDLRPASLKSWEGKDLLKERWRRTAALQLVPFAYEVLDLEAMGEVDLERFAELFRPVGSTALCFRRDGEVFCESLEEDFARLLQGSDGTRSPAEIFGGAVNRRVAEEVVEFALAEGFLVPARGKG